MKNNIEFSDLTLPLAVVVTKTLWNEPARIRQQITRQLTRFFNVIYVQKINQSISENIEKINDRLFVYTPVVRFKFFPQLITNIPIIHYFVNQLFYKKIIKKLVQYQATSIILVNFEYDFPEIMKWKGFGYKIYICNDEFPGMARSETRPNQIKYLYQSTIFQHYENVVAKKADLILTQHNYIKRKLKKYNTNIEILFPGHEFNTVPNITVKNNDLIKVAFMGFINYRLKMDWLKHIANQKDMCLYLIGPREKNHTYDFDDHQSIKFINTVEGEGLLNTMASMDVLIMPYNVSIPEVKILTINNKIFQYIAALRPIVISDLPNYHTFPDGIMYKAKTKEDFVHKIRQAVIEDCDEYRQLRKEIARENTWDKKGDILYNYISKELMLENSGEKLQ